MLNENEIIIHQNQTEMMDFMEDVNDDKARLITGPQRRASQHEVGLVPALR